MKAMPQVDKPLSELYEYNGTNPRPEDFDEYWDSALLELTRHMSKPEFAPEFRPSAFTVPGYDFSDLYFDGTGGARIHAKCLFPQQQSAENGDGTRPAVLMYHGYSGSAGDWTAMLPFAAAGAVVCAMDVRGQGGTSTDPGGVAGNTLHGHIIRGLDGAPEDLFYRHVFLDTVALARIVMDFSVVDETRVGTFGGSQGGALSFACAALEPRISRAFGMYPFLCDYQRVWEMDLGQGPYQELRDYFRRFDPRHERAEEAFIRLGYIDIQHLAPRIRGDVIMAMGLMDEICPPSTQMAVYNRISANKRLLVYPDFGHEDLPDAKDIALRFLARLLPE